MNIKSLLLGSAAALAVVSGAQAADAIVAAEPEPMEYVRVCDAFGTGYFYIPGTETCLKIGGEIRVGASFGDDINGEGDDYESGVRARIAFTTKTSSEIGEIGTFIRFEGFGFDDSADSAGSTALSSAFITVGGFKLGYFDTYLDDVGTAAEGDAFISNAKFNSASYTYTSDAFTIGLGVDDLSSNAVNEPGIGAGVQGFASATFGVATVYAWAAYDFEAEEGLVVGKVAADVGPGTFELYAGYASDPSTYASVAEWTVGAAYGFKATDKLTITPSVNYWSDVAFVDGDEAWGAGLLVEYALAEGLKASATADYFDLDSAADGEWTGFVRLTRSF